MKDVAVKKYEWVKIIGPVIEIHALSRYSLRLGL